MSIRPLKLVRDDNNPPDSYVLERRQNPRRVIGGQVTTVSAAHDQPGITQQIRSLQLRDISDTGVGAISQNHIAVGSSITVYFPPHGPEQGFDLYGDVVRCEPTDQGYRIGIQVTPARSACA